MDAQRGKNATLVDLLDRVLDKGLVLNADLIISVSGIPLIGLNLRAAIAGVDTMLNYGMWNDWDAAQRISAGREYQRHVLDRCLSEKNDGTEILLETFGSYWHYDGIYNAWRPGQVILTETGVTVRRKEPSEIIFAAGYADIDGIATKTGTNTGGEETMYYHLFLKDGTIAKIHTRDQTGRFAETCRDAMERAGYLCKTPAPQPDTPPDMPLMEDETILCRLPMWHRARNSSVSKDSGDIWRPGRMYVTSEQLVWHYESDAYPRCAVGLDTVGGVTITTESISSLLRPKEVLTVRCRDGTQFQFSGNKGLVLQVADTLRHLLSVRAGPEKTPPEPEMAIITT